MAPFKMCLLPTQTEILYGASQNQISQPPQKYSGFCCLSKMDFLFAFCKFTSLDEQYILV